MSEAERGGEKNHALGKCGWMQPREPAEGGGSLPCALTRNRASPNWNDFMLKGSSRLKSRQVSLSCPSVIFSIHLYTQSNTGVLTHTQAFTHTFRALAALNQSPCPAEHLVQNAKGLDGFLVKFFKLCQRSDPQSLSAYSSSSSSSSGSGSNSSFRHSL